MTQLNKVEVELTNEEVQKTMKKLPKAKALGIDDMAQRYSQHAGASFIRISQLRSKPLASGMHYSLATRLNTRKPHTSIHSKM